MTFVNVRELKQHPSRVLKRAGKSGWVIILSRGKPAAALMPLTEDEIEDIVLSSPRFVKTLRRSYAEYRRKGGISLKEARKHLGLS